MSGKRLTEEFKIKVVKQVTERGHPASEVASRLGVSQHSLSERIKRFTCPYRYGKVVVPRTLGVLGTITLPEL